MHKLRGDIKFNCTGAVEIAYGIGAGLGDCANFLLDDYNYINGLNENVSAVS
jgi:hypothetical protein